MEEIEIIKPDDWHVHFRDNDILNAVVPETSRHFARAIVMPNLIPPILNGIQANKYKKRNNTSNYNAGGGLSSSPSDYGKFLACMLNQGELNGVKILNKETFNLMNSPQLNEFKTTHRYVSTGNVDNKPRGDKDNFFDSYDNWTLAWAYEENSIKRPVGTAYWAGFFNTYFTIDFDNEFALVYMTQILPFNDIHSYNLFTAYERLVYGNLKTKP